MTGHHVRRRRTPDRPRRHRRRPACTCPRRLPAAAAAVVAYRNRTGGSAQHCYCRDLAGTDADASSILVCHSATRDAGPLYQRRQEAPTMRGRCPEVYASVTIDLSAAAATPWRRSRCSLVHAQAALVEGRMSGRPACACPAAPSRPERSRGTTRSPHHRGSGRWPACPSSPSNVLDGLAEQRGRAVLVNHRRHPRRR